MPPPAPSILQTTIGGRRLADAVVGVCRLTRASPSLSLSPAIRPHSHATLSYALRVQCRHFCYTPVRAAADTSASGTAGPSATADAGTPSVAAPDKRSYFLSNTLFDRVAGLSPGSAVPPHRRRKAARQQAKLEAAAAAAASESADNDNPAGLPVNASAVLTDMAARQQTSLRRLASSLLSLTKPRLSALVVLTAMAPYALYPVPSFLSPELVDAPSLSPLTLLFLTTGTALCSASANALNMLYEPDTDARMSRTRNRPLVRSLVSRRAALLFAVACGVVGVGALEWGVNPTTAFLGAANIALYAGVYTPMKRLSVANTWVGAVVGGIPPLMGWTAAAGEASTYSRKGSGGGGSGGDSENNPREFRELLFAPDGSSTGGWLLAALLFAWQFPHFMALSWAVRHEYQRAGLRMLAWVDPARNGRVALRYAAAFVPICVGLCAAGVTSWTFAATSLPVNAWLVVEAYKFWRLEGHRGSARALFWASVWHLPAVMVLALLQKRGMWTRVYHSVVGEAYEEEDDFDDDDFEEEEEAAQLAQPARPSQPVQPAVQSVSR